MKEKLQKILKKVDINSNNIDNDIKYELIDQKYNQQSQRLSYYANL